MIELTLWGPKLVHFFIIWLIVTVYHFLNWLNILVVDVLQINYLTWRVNLALSSVNLHWILHLSEFLSSDKVFNEIKSSVR